MRTIDMTPPMSGPTFTAASPSRARLRLCASCAPILLVMAAAQAL